MEFSDFNQAGGGGALMGLLAGSALSKKDEDKSGSYMIFAVIVFAIIFIIALVFLAMAFRDNRGDRRDGIGGDYAGLLATITAAKCADGGYNGKNGYDHDHMEIKNQISHSEDRREISGIKSELGAVALMMQKTAAENEKDNLKEFGEVKQQLGALNMGMTQVLTTLNNKQIIDGVITQLMMGKPCGI